MNLKQLSFLLRSRCRALFGSDYAAVLLDQFKRQIYKRQTRNDAMFGDVEVSLKDNRKIKNQRS